MPRAWLSTQTCLECPARERAKARQPPKKEWLREAGSGCGWPAVQPRERANRRLPSFFNQPPRQGQGLCGVLERREADASDAHTHEGSRHSVCFACFHDSSLYDASEELPWSSSSSSEAAAWASRLRLLLVLTPTGASGSYCGFGHPSINTGAQKKSVGIFFI